MWQNTMSETATFERYDQAYWTYTSQLSDERLPAFIKALIEHKPISFKGKIFYLRRILMTDDKTIIVLKELNK